MMKYLPYGAKPGYVARAKKCCGEHPVLTAFVVLLAVAALVFSIVVVVKLLKRNDELLDDE